MSAPASLTHLFAKSDRARGDHYAEGGRVRLLRVTPIAIEASVQGAEVYPVHLSYEPETTAVPRLTFSCTCPRFDETGACKHVWATLVVAAERVDTGLAPIAARAIARPAGEVRSRPLPPRASSASRFLKEVTTGLADVTPLGHSFARLTDALIYVFNLDAPHRGGDLTLEVFTRERRKTGAWGPPRPARISPHDLPALTTADAEVLSLLVGTSQAAGSYGRAIDLPTSFAVPPATARIVVPLIGRTGRAHVLSRAIDANTAIPIAWDEGAPWTFAVSARSPDDTVTLEGRFERGEEVLAPSAILATFESGFLFTRTHLARAVLPPYRSLFKALLKHGPVDVPQSDAMALAESLARAGVSSPDLPAVLRVPEIDVEPIRRLTVQQMPGGLSRDELEATASFDYGGVVVAADGPLVAWDRLNRRVVRRRAETEAQALERLATLGVLRHSGRHAREPVWTLSARTMPATVRTLVAEGWFVEAEGRRYQSATRVALSVTSGIDWFDLKATIEFAGETATLAEVLASLKRGENAVRLGDGSMGLLPEAWLARYAPLAAMGDVEGDQLRFTLPQAAVLDALLAAQDAEASVTIDKTFATARQALRAFDKVEPSDPPASFTGTLRPYQREGLGWLEFLRRFGFGGCLADDMGLGKTVMVLAMLDALRHAQGATGPSRPSLVVAPRSVVHNWLAEAARFAPALRVRDHSQATRTHGAATWDDADVAIATYGTLRRDIAELKEQPFEYVILDEAQTIKNAGTASAKAARLLRARHRLALSGTPIENHLGELWSLFEFLNPGLLGRSSQFAGMQTATRTIDPETAELLARAVRPFVLRRTKSQVATDLPPRTEQTIVCELGSRQRAFYNTLRQHYRERLLRRVDRVGLGKSKLQVLEALLRLRQAACHPGLVDATEAQSASAKLDTLLSRLREVIAEGHKALVFSQFTAFLTIVRAALEKEGLVYEYLDGRTRDREARVTRFQTDAHCPLFLISLKAGGLGLNLTAADYVFLLDPWWNPAVEAQAIDRSHRIGQQAHVFAYRLIAGDTVEEKVLELQQSKRALADAILRADAGLIGQLGRDDLERLLS